MKAVTPFQFINSRIQAAGLCVACVVGFWLLLNPFMGWDIWWHIKIGNEVLYQGGWPEQDTYTYTVPDDDFVIHSWLADCMFAAIYEVMGENGLLALRLIVLVIAMGLFLWYGKNTARLWPMGILMLILFSTSVHERW